MLNFLIQFFKALKFVNINLFTFHFNDFIELFKV